VAIEIATAVIAFAAETAGATIFEPLERNENGKRTRRSQAPEAPSHWTSRMESTIRQRAQELTQLNRTVGQHANLVETCAAHAEAQRLAMITWLQERKQKWDACHEDAKLWGAGITNMIAKTMQGVAQGQEGRHRERAMTARTEGGGLETSHHADTRRNAGLDELQLLQQQPKPKPKLQLKPQPKPQPAPKQKPALTPARQRETNPP
jgi:hypothetical protein